MDGWFGRFLYFGSKWFGGYPRAKGRDVVNEHIRSIIKQAPNLAGIDFYCNEYINLALKNNVIYCDPPYRNTTNGYSSSLNYDKFYWWCKEQYKLGCTVLVSEYDMPSDFKCIWEKETSVNFDSNRVTKQPRVEKLFILKP